MFTNLVVMIIIDVFKKIQFKLTQKICAGSEDAKDVWNKKWEKETKTSDWTIGFVK